MARLAQDTDQLEGWGSIKKAVSKAVGQVATITKAVVAPSKSSVKKASTAAVQVKKDLRLNKLGTRKAVKSLNHATAAVVTGNKKSAKQAALRAGQSPAAMMVITAAGNAIIPGSGALLAAGANAVAAKEESKVVAGQINAALSQAISAGYEAGAAGQGTATDAMPAATTATATSAPADNPWPKRILWGSLGLLTAAGLLKAAGYKPRSKV